MAELEPVAPLIEVKSLEEPGEESDESEAGIVMDNDEVELCEIVAVYPNCRFAVGSICTVSPVEYHYAPRSKEGTLFVRDCCIVQVEKSG